MKRLSRVDAAFWYAGIRPPSAARRKTRAELAL
jgi:hypothetical protein